MDRQVDAKQSGTWTVGLDAGTSAIGTVSTKTNLAPTAPASASLGLTSSQVVAANSTRKGLVLINVSSGARISFGIGVDAVLDSGITLYPGGVWEMDEYTFDTGAINAIASLAATSLAIQEFN